MKGYTTYRLLDLSIKETRSINSRHSTARSAARRHGAEGKNLPAEILEKFREYDNKCYFCHRDLTILGEDGFTMDHYIPLARGGTNYISNIVPACKTCNFKKGKKMPKEPIKSAKEWRQETPSEKECRNEYQAANN